jgi:hypothetical protein
LGLNSGAGSWFSAWPRGHPQIVQEIPMKKMHGPNSALIWVVAFSSSAVLGQSPPAANDPNAAVPPVVYQSVFADTPKGVETQTIDWKKANAEVGQFRRGHVDILKWEESNPQAKPPTPGNPPGTPARPAADIHKH